MNWQHGLCYEVVSKKFQGKEVNISPFTCRMHVRVVFCLYKYFHLQRILPVQQCSPWSCAAESTPALAEAAVPWSWAAARAWGSQTKPSLQTPHGLQELTLCSKWQQPLSNTKYANNHLFPEKVFLLVARWDFFVCFQKNMHFWYFSI